MAMIIYDKVLRSLRATSRSVAISGILPEIASSKLTIFPRNDDVGTICSTLKNSEILFYDRIFIVL